MTKEEALAKVKINSFGDREKTALALVKIMYEGFEKEKKQLEKQVKYWKLSFQKQVLASRGGYQPIKQHDGEPASPPEDE